MVSPKQKQHHTNANAENNLRQQPHVLHEHVLEHNCWRCINGRSTRSHISGRPQLVTLCNSPQIYHNQIRSIQCHNAITEQKQVKVAIVPFTHCVVEPRTKMIESRYTVPSKRTMLRASRLWNLTRWTNSIPRITNIMLINLLKIPNVSLCDNTRIRKRRGQKGKQRHKQHNRPKHIMYLIHDTRHLMHPKKYSIKKIACVCREQA
mmetsp:Transcript_2663/g.10232  ORF Transcript_2663/g.10232 Transcript_2663/m.10232 type:complete len:206 (+) Transcript_2663:2364-2981(+)